MSLGFYCVKFSGNLVVILKNCLKNKCVLLEYLNFKNEKLNFIKDKKTMYYKNYITATLF